MNYYKRHLPHWQPEGAEYFITFRLAGSLPQKAVNRLNVYRERFEEENEQTTKDEVQRKIFKKYELLLDEAESGPTWLREVEVAAVVQSSLHYYDGKTYDLYAYCLMPNHVHAVFKHIAEKENGSAKNDQPITKIMHSIKSYSALECNKILNRTGSFWQAESYDRVIRNSDELENTVRYTLNNPVKAALADHWKEWEYNYWKPEFVESFM